MITTLAQFKTSLVAILGLDSSADDTLMGRWINEGYEDFVRETGCYTDSATIALTSGVHTYDLPTQAMAILEINNADSTTAYSMERRSLQDILEKRRATGSAPARCYAVVGANLLTLYPTPGAGEELTIYYVVRPSVMSAANDTPTGVPAQFHQAIEYYALARAAEYDNHGPSQFGTYYKALYEVAVRECRTSMQGMGGRRSAPLTVGRHVSMPSDPSQTLPYVWR